MQSLMAWLISWMWQQKKINNFVVFLHKLSKYSSLNDLPPRVNDVEMLQEEVDKWLQYFPDAKLRGHRRDICMAILISWSMPFTKFMKKLSPWCKEQKYGLWPYSLQSEKLISLAWLLFSTNLMDTVLLKQAITYPIYGVPIGLWWKMINLGVQGKVKPEDQIKTLYLYMVKLDMIMAKLLLTTLYPSKPADDHQFPSIWMHL